MDFPQEKRKKTSHEHQYHIENLHLARAFSKELIFEMKELVRSVVLFGSSSSDTTKKESDIDILVILDNVSVFVTPELRESYNIITQRLSKEYAQDKVHLMTLNLSDFWDLSRKGDPLLISILRTGQILFDRDLVDPMQYLLEIGKIRPSKETVINYLVRSENLYEEHKNHLYEAVLDLYYAVVDSAHALLMSKQIMPEGPKHIPELFEKHFESSKLKKHLPLLQELYNLAKDIEHKNLDSFKGSNYDKLEKRVQKLLQEFSVETRENLQRKEFMW